MRHLIPDPPQTPETAFFWQAANERRLIVRHCRSCGANHYYPRAICPHCFSEDTEWIESSGLGTIYSFSINRLVVPAFITAYVTLEEGVTMLTNVVGCDPASLSIGDQVVVIFVPSKGSQLIPNFKKVEKTA